MRHIIYVDSEIYPIALLVKASAFNKEAIRTNYLYPLTQAGVKPSDVIAFTLNYNEVGKAPAAFIKEYLEQLLPELHALGTKHLYVADANYFKVLAGVSKADPHFGYPLPCKIKGFEHMTVVLGLNYGALIYNPELQSKLDMSLKTLVSTVDGTYVPLGQSIIHSAYYPEGVDAIAKALESLHQYPALTSDIEAFSLRFNEAGIGTITFCWDKHNGLAFPVDYQKLPKGPPLAEDLGQPEYGVRVYNHQVRALLRKFFETYQGHIDWHKADYDVKVLIYELWMKHPLDTEGLLNGLEIMTRHFGDTKVIAYLATNSTAGNILGLKALAHEFAGNWAIEEIKDIRKIPLDKLLQYNLVDGLSTAFVRDKYTPIMVADQQLELYNDLFLPSLKLIIQLELTGMPLIPEKVKEARVKLEMIREEQLDVILGSKVIDELNILLRQAKWEKDFEFRKGKAKNPDKIFPKQLSAFDGVSFNPNSGPQLQRLLYELMGLPVIDLTDTKQPATGGETLAKLINHTQVPEHKALLAALIDYGLVDTVLTTFIPSFEEAVAKADGIWWLHGSFNLGGTVSGRLSSSDPNLQNLPAGTTGSELKKMLGKLCKECFAGPAGWLFAGADFNSLEDYISALTTKDPNKVRVYTDGYDGHCLRAYSYFRDQLGDIRQAEPDERCFEVKTTTGTLLCKTGDLILLPNGTRVPVEEYFDTHTRI